MVGFLTAREASRAQTATVLAANCYVMPYTCCYTLGVRVPTSVPGKGSPGQCAEHLWENFPLRREGYGSNMFVRNTSENALYGVQFTLVRKGTKTFLNSRLTHMKTSAAASKLDRQTWRSDITSTSLESSCANFVVA